MKILVTGAGGFIGKNLISVLHNMDNCEVLEFHAKDGHECLRTYCAACDFVFHLAGVNRPEDEAEFETGNVEFTRILTSFLAEGSRCPVIFSSSLQAELDNPYGRSKRGAEKILREYEEKTGTRAALYRLPNVFGKWCRPDYNSVIATFCHHTANGLPVHVRDENRMLRLVYIDDVVAEFVRALKGTGTKQGDFYIVPEVYERRLGDIANQIQAFSLCAETLEIPNQADAFAKKLYSTYLSYLPEEKLQYALAAHSDARGLFAEFLRTEDRGQLSINVTRPGHVKGNHWHHTKHEIFLAVSGEGVIRLRKIGERSVIEIPVRGDRLEPVIIPPGCAHMLENSGDVDLVTVMWANEPFDSRRPDTFYLDVREKET